MDWSAHRRWLWMWLAGVWLCYPLPSSLLASDAHARYFEQLRRRGMYSLAEGYAISRLAQSNVSVAQRTEFAIELSRTFSEHASHASEQQQADLWKRARVVVDDERKREPNNPRSILLSVQSAMVIATEGDWLKFESELRPFDEPLRARARETVSLAIQSLEVLERSLSEPAKDGAAGKRATEDGSLSHEMRLGLQQVRWQLGLAYRNLAELMPAESQARSDALEDAAKSFRKLIGVADDPLPFRAKLGLASCSRLKGDLDRSLEMLAALEKTEPRPSDELLDELVAERARALLAMNRAADAVELIVRTRSKRKRLTGELWFLQVRSLAALRDLALQRNDQTLADQVREQAEVSLERCDEQVGGLWSRRCHRCWESVRTSERYGPELDAAMQQARADFLAGRIEAALKGYAEATKAAADAGQTDLAIDLAYTRASILLREKQFEMAAAEFMHLAEAYPKHSRAPSAHLNGAYCLGRLSDQAKTAATREAYVKALDEHIEWYEGHSSVDDARFLRAQLEEQRLRAAEALPLYLLVNSDHPRAEAAHAGAARCYEAMLVQMRERRLPTQEFEQEAVDSLTRMAPSFDAASEWTVPQTELALHLSAILLLAEPPRFAQADDWLGAALLRCSQVPSGDEQEEQWRRLRMRSAALRVVSLTGSGRVAEAEKQVNALANASPRDLVAIVERLAPFVESGDRHKRVPYVELQLKAAELLLKHRDKLAKAEQETLDRRLGWVYLANGQTALAVERLGILTGDAPKNVSLQREIAQLLEKHDDRECQSLARQCWRRVETATKPGSLEWLIARLGVIECNSKLGQHDVARKLFENTRAIHQDLGGSETKARYMAADQELKRRAEAAR